MSEKILIIDTATENCSAALVIDGNVTSLCEEAPREHSQKILPFVKQLLDDAGVVLEDLDAIGFGRGPGSFTGIRIGTSMMQGMALGAELPVLPISNLAAMAQGAMDNGAKTVIAAIDARMGEVYVGRYENVDGLATLIEQELVIAPDAVMALPLIQGEDLTAVGTGFETYPELLDNGRLNLDGQCRLPSAKMMVPLALSLFSKGFAQPLESVEPVYLRDNVAWKKAPGK
ncbi:tRNA (adenosine(37)-N6)-threonylcarbamoyltransferase complex dimerization subunit type 1 TsaB [Ferrimonas aestuarii]|uniref:tRNA threonylcarbamoyladenosine biosynthesis protein TsaB n=1 Tax=Ferrimonas aestuarii TaxID=2569539 RepID=A0A4U1BKQ7_9GAMM|nr:tRNA (adenosine(37)-N6)-threonylcarbamoyltransferase complex dimerization subunit type 1 TsaB [Ferrimonas aestuarii]TKB52806.1 tRNA (adenosine(37)-N6)-threonylcarbamoyltransferase complex dimerization subunit type 1 TsaB [Ferrimonas aestuarii]